jgi:Protein kinase domain
MTAAAEADAACVDEALVLSFFAGTLPVERMTAFEQHIDDCSACAALVQAAAPLVLGASGRPGLGALPAHAEPGHVLAERYRLERLIGWGATGFVFRAQDQMTGTPVAVKMLRNECALQPEWLERLIRELKVARALMHPNLCRVFDLSVHADGNDGSRFLVLELGSGSLLDELQREDGAAVSLPRALRDGEGIASALATMHDAGILHRDLKPANLLRMTDGRLVISDFGLASIQLDRTAMTRFVGTPLYMAPEVTVGESATAASDVWSLGMVLHELCFRRRPLWHTTRRGLRLLAAPPGPTSPAQRGLLALCRECLSPLPKERPSARRLAARLRALADGKLPSRIGSRAARWWVGAALAAGGLATGIARYEPPTVPAAPPQGYLEAQVITQVISQNDAEITLCFEGALKRGQGLSGRVSVRFLIGPDGAVISSELDQSTLGDHPAETCIVNAVRGLRFPKPQGGGVVSVIFPFLLSEHRRVSRFTITTDGQIEIASKPMANERQVERAAAAAAAAPINWCYRKILGTAPTPKSFNVTVTVGVDGKLRAEMSGPPAADVPVALRRCGSIPRVSWRARWMSESSSPRIRSIQRAAVAACTPYITPSWRQLSPETTLRRRSRRSRGDSARKAVRMTDSKACLSWALATWSSGSGLSVRARSSSAAASGTPARCPCNLVSVVR